MSDIAPDANLTVSVEQDGRTLSGVGVTKESLQETMDARSVDVPAAESSPATAVPAGSSAAATSAPEPPQLTKGRARYSELTQQRDAEKARADAAEKRAAEIEARLSALPRASVGVEERTTNDPQAGAKPAPQPTQPPPPSWPEPTEDEVGVGLKYETYGAFVKDHHAWSWEQQQSAIDQRVQQGIAGYTQAQQFQAHVESTRDKGRKAYKDFDAMLQNGPGTYVNMPAPAVQAIYHLPNSEHVQYAIMKDGALAQRLAGLAATNPYAFGLELSKIAPAAPAASPASMGTSGSATPPAPMQPVGSGSTTTTRASADAAKAGNYAEYKALRTAERGGRRR